MKWILVFLVLLAAQGSLTEDTTSEGSTGESPTSKVYTSDDPITEVLTSEGPTTVKSSSDDPITEVPTSEGPTTAKSTSDDPITEVPTSKGPTTEKSTPNNPITEVPTSRGPTTEGPTTTDPNSDKKEDKDSNETVFIVVGVIVLALAVLVGGALVFWARNKRRSGMGNVTFSQEGTDPEGGYREPAVDFATRSSNHSGERPSSGGRRRLEAERSSQRQSRVPSPPRSPDDMRRY